MNAVHFQSRNRGEQKTEESTSTISRPIVDTTTPQVVVVVEEEEMEEGEENEQETNSIQAVLEREEEISNSVDHDSPKVAATHKVNSDILICRCSSELC